MQSVIKYFAEFIMVKIYAINEMISFSMGVKTINL